MNTKIKKLRLGVIIRSFNTVQEICKNEANINPLNKDMFQSGKQQAYSHMYFLLKPIIEKLNFYESDTYFYKIAGILFSFLLGFLFCMVYFK